MQRISVLAFTPRGSKPMMSKRLRRRVGNGSRPSRTKSTPDPPGPPGLISSEPMRSLVGRRRSEERHVQVPAEVA